MNAYFKENIMSNLFINACVRAESRTLTIARDVIKKSNLQYDELILTNENLTQLNTERLTLREKLLSSNDLSHEMFKHAKQFAEAENIIIAAPYWDLGFPALLKIYLENICVPNITFKYTENGPVGLCKAKSLTYITTAGGKIFADFGYSYIKTLANSLFGITSTICIKAENLDIENISNREVLKKAKIITTK